jgi:hypothetical protein
METIIYDYKEGGIIEKIKAWLCLDCLEKWKDNWSGNALYHQERSVDDQEVLSYNNYLEQRVKELRSYLYS